MHPAGLADLPLARRVLRPAPVWLALVLAACGGGGSDGVATPAPGGTGGGTPPLGAGGGSAPTCGLANFQADMLAQVNARRAAGANCGARGTFASAGALQWNAVLTNAAAGHSQDMATQNFFSHTGTGGTSTGQRVVAAGYTWQSVAENIAAGYPSVQSVMDAWMASDGHCANIMSGTLQDIGVACVPGATGNTYSTYWTMDLAAPL